MLIEWIIADIADATQVTLINEYTGKKGTICVDIGQFTLLVTARASHRSRKSIATPGMEYK